MVPRPVTSCIFRHIEVDPHCALGTRVEYIFRDYIREKIHHSDRNTEIAVVEKNLRFRIMDILVEGVNPIV
jgi:hypothetical protein